MLLVAAAVLSSCSEGAGRTAEGYCGQIQLHLSALNEPAIDDGADIDDAIEVYRTITAAAPAAVEPEWQQLLTSLETASTVDPADPASVQRVADTARATKPAATKVQQYTQQTCALRIADPPPVTNPVTATTAPPPLGTGTSDSTATPDVTGQGGG